MPENTNIFLREFKSRPLAYGVQIVGIVIVLLNVWLSTKLFPMAQNIDSIISRVNAMENNVKELQVVSKGNQEIVVRLENISVSLSEVKARIERIDTRLAKHMGI